MSATLLAKYEALARRFQELDAQLMASGEMASDPARVAELSREHGRLRRATELWRDYKAVRAALDEATALLADNGSDPDLRALADQELPSLGEALQQRLEHLREHLLAEQDTRSNRLIMEIRAGTGGDEAALFAGDLFEMYRRHAERRRWRFELLSTSEGAAGGYREIAYSLAGEGVWRELAFESGGHRVQRVPATETQGRVHTSAATVAVLNEPEDTNITIAWDDPKTVREETMRSSGPGGQNVNKVNSAVRLTHLETGIVVHIQGRDYHKNRAEARRLMLSRVYEYFESRDRAAREQTRRTLIGSGDRNERIRTYNFPQNRCTDHRINRNFALDRIMAGDLDELVTAMFDYDREERIKAL